MSSGKKVFTGAGEKLAEFLLSIKKDTTTESILTTTLADINNTGVSSSLADFQKTKVFSKEEVITYFKREILKELNFVKVSDGQKEYSLQKMVQFLYNNTKRMDTLTEAQFQALSELVMDNLADIFKSIGTHERKFSRLNTKLANDINNLRYKKLDYFTGNEDDKSGLYYRSSGAKMLICDGAGVTNHKFYEVFRCTSKTPVPNQAYLGDILSIGGSEIDSPFKKIELTKEVLSQGNITMANGKELVGTALRARYADLAEFYTSNMEYRPGTLLQIDTENQNEVTIWDPSNTTGCIGVVSDKPGLIINEGLVSDFAIVPIVLTGQSPVRILGNVSKGDYIYPSLNVPGAAVAVRPENALDYEKENPLLNRRLGYALESSQTMKLPEFETNTSNINNQEFLIRTKLN